MKYEERIKKYSELNKTDEETEQKIGLIIKGNYIASNYIRILSPFSNFFNTKYDPYLIDRPDFDTFKKDLENDEIHLDIIIIQRDALEEELAELLVTKCKLFGIKLIFEIDDDLINMDKSSPIYPDFLPRIKTMEFIAENSDCITVSTDILRERMLMYNDNVITIPNSLTDYWQIKKQTKKCNNSDTIKIGYMGTITHTKDLKIIENVIKNIKKKYSNKNIIFEIIEGTTEEIEGINIIRIPKSDEFYPNFVSWLQNNINWDIAIAPLVKEDPINLSKSELKYLEYTALNIPGVYSAVGPYDYAIVHEKNGMLVKENSPSEWERNLSKLIDNINLREKIIRNAWNDVKHNYLVSNLVNNWKKVLDNNNRDKTTLLYKKIKEYYAKNHLEKFNDFLIKESQNIILESKIFNEKYYLTKYPDVNNCGLSAISHYISIGYKENCFPNEQDNKILSENTDLTNNFNLHPVTYYILYGNDHPFYVKPIHTDNNVNEKLIRKHNILDSEFYLIKHPDIKKAKMDPIFHYAKYGYKEEYRKPNPHFSNKFYTETYLGDNRLWNPLTHYILYGKEKGFKTNPWDIPKNFDSIKNVSLIMDKLLEKVSIIMPIYNYSTKIVDNLNSIMENTFGNYELILIISNEILDKYDNFDWFKEVNFRIILNENKDHYDQIYDLFLDIENDVVLLNSYTQITYNWLSRIIIKAYSSEDIDLVSPISNFIGNINPFIEDSEENEFMYTAQGIDTILRKSSSHKNIYSEICDGFCTYIKQDVLSRISFDNNRFLYDYENKFCYFNIPKDISHVIDDSIYVYHDISFFNDNKHVLKEFENNFFTELHINKFLKSPQNTNIKTKFKLSLYDKNQTTLSNRILYILDEKNLNYFKDFIGYYATNYYDCYFLTSDGKNFKLWEKSKVIKKWELTNNLKYSLRNKLFKKMYLNILYYLNINIVHIINLNNNSFDLFDVIKSININVIFNCTDDFYIHPLQEEICSVCNNNEACWNDTLKELCASTKKELSNLLNMNDLIIDNMQINNYNHIIKNNENLRFYVDYPNDKSILNISEYKFNKTLSLLLLGDLSQHKKLIEKLRDHPSNKSLSINLMSNNLEPNEVLGFNHNPINIKTFPAKLSEINPDFIIINNEFPEIYDIIYEAKVNKKIVLLNSEDKNNLSEEYSNCLNMSKYIEHFSYNSLLNLRNSEIYYSLLKEMYYADEKLKDNVIHLTKCFSELYSENGDSNPKEIVYKNPRKINETKDITYTNFEEFLNHSYVSPLIPAPFNSVDQECFRTMDKIAKDLEKKAISNYAKPLVSIIMPVYNREDIVQIAINSVLNQTYTNFELIIVDDGSTDETIPIITNIQDNRVKVILSETNNGSSAARNIGLKEAKGEYICYLDSDNIWQNNYIGAIVGAFLELNDADAIYSGQMLYDYIDEEPFAFRFGSFNKSLLLNGNYIDLNCFAHKKEVYDKIGGFNENLNRLVDWELILRTSNNFKMYSIPILLSNYYFEAAKNRISNYSSKSHEKSIELFKNYAQNIHNDNLIFKKSEYILKKPINIVIYNINSLITLQECLNKIFSFDSKMIKVTIIDDNLNKNITNYIYSITKTTPIKIINNKNNLNIIENIKSLIDIDSDIVLLDSQGIIFEETLKFMQEYAYTLEDCGIIVPQQVLPDGSNQIKKLIPYANPDFKCDITPTIYPNNIINMSKFNNGEILELKIPPLFCTYLKKEIIHDLKNIDLNNIEYNVPNEFLSNYIRNIKKLKIYYISDAITYQNFNGTNQWNK